MNRASPASRFRAWTGLALIAAGALVLAWSLLVLVWEDPFTAAYTGYRQRSLSNALDEQLREWQERVPAVTEQAEPAEPAPSPAPGQSERPDEASPPLRPIGQAALRRLATRYHAETDEGSAIARLTIPRLGLAVIVVNGTSTADLRAGPGRHLATAMPGEGRLVYVAGHRTTFGAPFSRIDELRPGDEVRLALPYATLIYRVLGHTIVDDNDTSVLAPGTRERLALQACHPRFFASHRYIVWARPTRALAPARSASRA